MNDRASAAPPVFFVGSEGADAFDVAAARAYPAKPYGFEKITPRTEPEPALAKRGSKQFLGQVWDGVLEKFRFGRKDTAPEEDKMKNRRRKHEAAAAAALPPKGKMSREDDRPSKEEVYANYHQLVASGFFSSHAIQSTRQPGTRQTQTQGASLAPPTPAKQTSSAPQWPLTPTPTATPVKHSPAQTPASATSSRGKKRPSISIVDERTSEDSTGDTLHLKKLRKTASTINRDLSVPRTRASSRTIGLRSFSNAGRVPSGAVATDGDAQKREPKKLIKRVPSRTIPPADDNVPRPSRRNVSESHSHHHPQSPPQIVVDSSVNGHIITAPDGTTRVLRPRRSAAEPLRVRPDANRGIPTVPDIPVKFTYGEDRENDGPWKGLRRTRAA